MWILREEESSENTSAKALRQLGGPCGWSRVNEMQKSGSRWG
jgi:hypothetical protein